MMGHIWITWIAGLLIAWIPSSICPKTYSYDFPYIKQYTRNVTLKQGVLQGIVVESRTNTALPPVEQFRGIPYAAPPVGELRFMPSGSAPSWFGTRYADRFGPVCPQRFPDTSTMTPDRKEQFLLLKRYLQDQSEDCLYLNVYAPYQERILSSTRYPVMVYIHGESFEWNSGNPYDGTVLAAYGKVIVVTLNFRLGVLGFLKAGTEEHSKSNFGLVDQIAALLWVKENIAAFGGDPDTVTVFGHGTGAVCASLLTLSPMVLQEGNNLLFQRAILMGGSAMADWALAGSPREVTYQVAQSLNCQIHDDDFAACLRRKRLDEIMAAAPVAPYYSTRFGPLVDSLVVPNEPRKSMTNYSDIFRRFELMYGVSEMESVHLLGPTAMMHGMLEKERDQELRKYLRSRCEMKPELCVVRTLAEYTEVTLDDAAFGGYTGLEPDRASVARDVLLDILSDARSVAPIVQTAKYHSALNVQSYFYVFSHKTQSKQYIRNKSYNGEELPYVFGVPLDGPKYHFTNQYTDQERLFSELVMTYFSNFAYTGDPNVPRRSEYLTLGPTDWMQFEVDWQEFDAKHERYLQMEIPPRALHSYRHKEMTFWNSMFPTLSNRTPADVATTQLKSPQNTNTFVVRPPPTNKNNIPPWILSHAARKLPPIQGKKHSPVNGYLHNGGGGVPPFGTVKMSPSSNADENANLEFDTASTQPELSTGATTMQILIIVGSIFLAVNLLLFLGLYYKCYRIKKDRGGATDAATLPIESNTWCFRSLFKSSRTVMKATPTPADICAGVEMKHSKQKSGSKLVRQMSNSTIDAHTKVRDWMTQEMVSKFSPALKGRRSDTLPLRRENVNFLLAGDVSRHCATISRPPLIKSASLPTNKPAKVSVAVDATPSGRGASVLRQQPIELFKSRIRRSSTVEDLTRIPVAAEEMRKSASINVNLQCEPPPAHIVRIKHAHSKSEPVQEIYSSSGLMKPPTLLHTFGGTDVNVTSRDDDDGFVPVPLTPAESLQTIKRRNFPKVLPDYLPNSKEALSRKRRSMPATSLFAPIPECGQPTTATTAAYLQMLRRLPPVPPPRGASTLTRQHQSGNCQSAPMLAEELRPTTAEPEIACNNLHVGPLVPRCLDTQPIYESLRSATPSTTHPASVKRVEPRVIIKASSTSMPASSARQQHLMKNIPRVVVNDHGEPEMQKPSVIPPGMHKGTVRESTSSSGTSEQSV